MSRYYTQVTPEMAAYIREVTLREPAPLRRLRQESEQHPESSCQISAEQGQFLNLLVHAIGAVRAIEVGVFMGYSSTWMALALPSEGELVACDHSDRHLERARETWREAGVESRIDFRLGPALQTLDSLLSEGRAGAYDLVFIDADKASYLAYYERALALLRPRGLVVADNVLWRGEVADPNIRDADAEAIRAFNRTLHADARISLSIAPIGDGFTVACKL